MKYEMKIFIIYLIYILVMSIVTFVMFCKDKKMAQKNKSEVRIKEKTLLGLVVFGGGLGGLIGRVIAHHKTNKIYFSFTIYLSILCQVGVLCALAYFLV